MNRIIIATRNKGKLKELQELLPHLQLLTLDDIGFSEEIPEPYDTFAANALQKANTIFKFAGMPVISDDSGLCIDALGGAPGVYSAEYSGLPRSDERNMARVLEELAGESNRSAAFVATICLILKDGQPHYFEGRCEGTIALVPSGSFGFGYDPIFIPKGFTEAMASLSPAIKNSISHRKQAIAALVRFCKDICEDEVFDR